MPGFLGKIEFVIGAILLAVITVLVFMAAVMRFVGHPLIWSVDLAQLLFIWLCFVGATRAMRERVHLGVDLLVRLLPFATRRVIETAMAALFIGFLLLLAYEGYKLTIMNWQRVFGDSGLSYAWVTIAVPVGSLLLTISILSNLVTSWRGKDSQPLLVFTRSNGTGADNPENSEV
ncbi:TRAP transporter small permease [uncultured Cohaesibacter sp.]|uniref:TRAP transporter small permease n=1 Tax=uncultured Cohaesibacter sp. TaxID=1002546 RepID=UPI002931DC82|nr:TRAP transporter small permease [uncultured Cohaesibacter sp.]